MTWRALVEAADGVRAALGDPAAAELPVAAIGWATVDLERAARELDGLLAGDPDAPVLGPWQPLDRDGELGARSCLRSWLPSPASTDAGAASHTTGKPGGPSLIVLEPDTEGPLAAFLARFGEGVGVIYLGAGPPAAGRLVRGGPAWGPHVIVPRDAVAQGVDR